MVNVAILVISNLLLLIAAVLALRLVRATGRTAVGAAIAALAITMSARRVIVLLRLHLDDTQYPPDTLAEAIGLGIACLLIVGVIWLHQVLTSLARSENALRDRTRDLSERVKELDCLYRISHLVETPGIAMGNLLRQVVELVRWATRYPDVVCARIVLEQSCFQTENFAETRWNEVRQIVVNDKPIGALDVRYLEKRTTEGHSCFLPEEQRLLDAVVEQLGGLVERKVAGEASERQRQELIQADKMITLGILVSGVAHEINNPNNFVMMNAPILQQAWADIQPLLEEYHEENGEFLIVGIPYSEMREHIPALFEGITEGARRMKQIVDHLRDYARQDSSAPTQPVDINGVLRMALRLLENQISKSTKHLRVSYGEGLPPVNGSGQRIEQVIINVLQNACQALPNPSGGISIRTGHDPREESVFVAIRDTGIGISPDDRERILDPFFTTKRHMGGTGLGLSICATIMNEHRGKLLVDSQVGHGTTVTLVFPAHY